MGTILTGKLTNDRSKQDRVGERPNLYFSTFATILIRPKRRVFQVMSRPNKITTGYVAGVVMVWGGIAWGATAIWWKALTGMRQAAAEANATTSIGLIIIGLIMVWLREPEHE